MLNKCALALVILFAFVTLYKCQAEPVLWSVSDGGTGHFYEAVAVPKGITWMQAHYAAIAIGAHLSTITSKNENQFVYNLANSNGMCWFMYEGWVNGCWLGGYRAATPDGHCWHWVTGEPWSYAKWAPGTPNNEAGIEDCLGFGGVKDAIKTNLWNDAYGESTLPGYVIEYESAPKSSSILSLSRFGGLNIEFVVDNHLFPGNNKNTQSNNHQRL